MRYCLALLFVFAFGASAYTQTATVKGSLVDSADNGNLQNAIVAVLKPIDSSLIKFTRVKEKGNFEISGLDTGKYIVMITHPYFADVFDNLTIKDGGVLDMGIMKMFSKIKMLEEVVVKSGAAIRMKGDTTVFNVDSFKVRDGANVEELLRKLPGIQVDKNGQITAMGETVKNVLVDGEEFFGNDPGIATKNLGADMVKEVEVYDKKSDQAVFTGIDDGVKEKTINLKLRENKKNGYFGKVEAGGSIPDRFNNAAMINLFKGKRKIAGYGIMSNTGNLNLDWQDNDKYGGATGNVEIMDGGGIMISDYDWDYNESDGIPTNWNAGLHYSNKFNNDKQSINAGYKFTKINAPSNIRMYSQNFIPDSSWLANSNTGKYASNLKHKMNVTFETQLDSANTIKLTAKGNKNTGKSQSNVYYQALTNDSAFINTSENRNSAQSESDAATGTLLWMHKFKKQYRTLSVNTGFTYNSSETESFAYSKADFYENNIIDSTSEVDQRRTYNNKVSGFNAKVAYTEPLAKDFYMELNYAFNSSNSSQNRFSYDKDEESNQYTHLNDLYSNDFTFKNTSNAPGINFRGNKKKYTYALGTSVLFNQYERLNNTDNTSSFYKFTNYSPQANFTYRFKPSESLRFNYNGNAIAPSLDQLQPVIDNTDQLNQRNGNPLLKPSFNHRFSFGYNSWKQLTESSIWANASYSFTQNAFVNFDRYENGIRYYETVNTNGVSNYSFYLDYGFKHKKSGIRFSFGPTLNGYRNINFIKSGNVSDVVKNITTSGEYGMGVGLYKNFMDEKVDFYVRPRITYNKVISTANPLSNQKYWTYGLNSNLSIKLPKDFDINTDVDGNYRQKTAQFPLNANYTLWNASVGKKFHKTVFETRFSVNDILNQNKGYERNGFTETYRTILRRYWLVSFIWNIKKNNGVAATPAQ